MVRVRGVYLRKPPQSPSTYSSKEAALAANPEMLVADAAFPRDRLESVKNAAFRVNSGGRGDYSPGEFFAVWEYTTDVILRVKPDNEEGSVEVLGFEQDGQVIGHKGESIGTSHSILKEDGVERGGWVLLIGMQPHVPDGWEEIVNSPGSRKRKRQSGPPGPDDE